MLNEMLSITSVPLEHEIHRSVRQAFQSYNSIPASEASVGD
jgi:hypothetical protein